MGGNPPKPPWTLKKSWTGGLIFGGLMGLNDFSSRIELQKYLLPNIWLSRIEFQNETVTDYLRTNLKRYLLLTISDWILEGTIHWLSRSGGMAQSGGMAHMVKRLLSIHLSRVRFPVFPTYWDCMDFYSCRLDQACKRTCNMRVKWVALSIHIKAWMRIKFEIHFP